MEYDPDQFPNGIPNVSAVVRGKKIYDPRQDSTSSFYDASVGVSTHRVNTPSTWTWSQNPALAVRDYLVDTKYGLGEAPGLINESALVSAADYCEIEVDGNLDPIPQLQINGIVDTANSRKENIDSMLSSMGGMLVYSGGSYFIRAAQYVSPTITIDESVMVAQIQVQTRQSRRSQYNGVKGIFLSKEKNYTVADYPAQISSTYATEDGDPIYLDMPLPFVTDNEQAQRLAKIALLKSRQQTVITVPVNLAGLKFKAGDVINITNERLGYDQKPFEVLDYSIVVEGSGTIRVDLRCIETASSIYNWLSSDAQDFLSGGELTLYDGRTTQAPTSLTATESTRINSDGAVIPTIEMAWTAASDAFVDHYEVEWKQSTASTYKTVNTVGTEYEIPIPVVGVTYNTRVRAVNSLGVRSTYITADVLMDGDTTAPAAPSSPGTNADVHTLIVSWTNPSDLDLSYVEIKRNSVNDEPSATVIGRSDSSAFVDGPFSVAQTFYYWVRAVDNTGNASAWVSAGSATTQQVIATDIAEGAVKGKTLALLLNQDSSGNAFAGNGAFVGVNNTGDPVPGTDGFFYWSGLKFTISRNQVSVYTFVTSQFSKTGYLVYDTQSASFTISGLGTSRCAFVWKEAGQWYYDNDSTAVAFTPSPPMLALAYLNKDPATQFISRAGLLAEPVEITTIADIFADYISAGTIDASVVNVTNLDADEITTGSLSADFIQIDGVTLDTDGAGNLIIKNDGVGTDQLATDAVTSDKIEEGAVRGKTLALLLNKNSDGTTNSGEGSLVGVDNLGSPVVSTDGFFIFDGTKYTVSRNQFSAVTFATQVVNKKGYLAYDISGANFSIAQGPSRAAFVWKEGGQWYYDDNSASPAVSFTPGTDILALAFIETSTPADANIKGGLLAEPIQLLSLSEISADYISVGTLSADRIQIDNITLDTDGAGTLIVANEGVDTTQIAGNAVSETFESSAGTMSTSGTTLVDTGLSLTVTIPAGATVQILISYDFQVTGTASTDKANTRLYEDTLWIRGATHAAGDTDHAGTGVYVLSRTNTSGSSSTRTYKMQAKTASASTSVQISEQYISITELKK